MYPSNYGGKIDQAASIKVFNYGSTPVLWRVYQYYDGTNEIPVITPNTNFSENLYIPGNIYLDGNIFTPSDIHIKENITEINYDASNKLINLKASQFTFKNDSTSQVHYGFIAQDFEKEFPELISIKPDKNMANIKAINYLEIIPLLVSKIQIMQTEIDELKNQIKKIK